MSEEKGEGEKEKKQLQPGTGPQQESASIQPQSVQAQQVKGPAAQAQVRAVPPSASLTPQPANPPAAAVPPPPPLVAPPVPPSKPAPPKSTGRRTFLKALVAISAVLSITPFVPWGSFLSSSVGSSGKYQRQKVVIDTESKYGSAAGKAVNVNDLSTFAPDSHWVITYPSSGDATLDAQNPDTFVKFELIRLPAGQPFNGDAKDAAAFVAFSKVCVHLWCSPNYNPAGDHEQYECPCHGSIYRIPDGLAIAGPAALQPPPTDVIPILTLSTDSDGSLWVEPPVWDVSHNGVIGYGRYIPNLTENTDAYKKYLKQ